MNAGYAAAEARSRKGKTKPTPLDRVLDSCPIEDAVAKLVLIDLAKHADWETNKLYRCVESIAAVVSKSVRTVQRKLNWLVVEGYIKRTSSYDPISGRQRANDYEIVWTAIDAGPSGPDCPRPMDGCHPPRASDRAELPFEASSPSREGDLEEPPAPAAGGIVTPGRVTPDVTPKTPTFRNPTSSEPVGSGPGEPAPGPKQAFSEGRKMLGDLGVSRKTAGDVISRWLRETGGDAPRVLGAIRSARDHGALSPIPWVITCLKPRTNHAHATGPSALDQALAASTERLRALEAPQGRHP